MFTPKLPLAILCSCLAAASAFAAVEIKKEPGKLVVTMNGQPFTEYVYEGASHTYFYPLLGPGGTKMTRSAPMADLPEEDKDHPHHRSLWYAHGNVNGIDFWSEAATFAGKTPKMPVGKILHADFLKVEGGEKSGVISSLNNWVAPDGTVTLKSVMTVTIPQTPDNERILDFAITLVAEDKEVVFGDTKEGTMALRVNENLRLKPNKAKLGTGHLLSSEGKKDGEVWGTQANWVDYYGEVDGKAVGIAMFDHPSNPHHPTRWHARDYGLFAANPFAATQMDKTLPPGSADLKIGPGEKATFKYRILIHEGDAAKAKIAERYAEYAK